MQIKSLRSIKKYPFKTSQLEKSMLVKEINKILKAGIIKPSRWSFTVILVPKSGLAQICVDYGKLNQRIIQDLFPFPRIEEILKKLRQSTYFSTIDLKADYW